MSEIAVVSSRKSKLESLNRKGDSNAKKILKTSQNPEFFLSTIQIAITAISLIMGLYSGKNLTEPLNHFLTRFGLGPSSDFISSIIVIAVITYITLVLGELLPKRIGLNNPEKVASLIITPMNFLTKLTYPFVLFLSMSTNVLIKLFRVKKSDNSVITEDEIKQIISESTEDGEIRKIEQDIVERVFSLGDRDISSLMTHRKDFEWIEIDLCYEEVMQKIGESMHYMYPVAEKTLDNIVGVVYIKDIFNKREGTVREVVKTPQFLPESTSVYHVLEIFKQLKISYALIIDEFGLVIGMVAMSDILESLVGSADEIGEVSNEYKLISRDENSWLVDGQYPFFDFLSFFELEDKYQELSYNTLSGLILDLTGKIPKEGEKIYWEVFSFEIVDMDIARIDKVIVSKNIEDKEK